MAKKSIRNDPDTNNMREIGERLRLLRENYGKEHGGKVISIEKFGKDVLKIGDLSESGMTDSAINNLVGDLERGTQVVSPAILRKYSQVCHVSIDYIINGTDYTPEPTHARITLKDLCEQIVILDRCNLIDVKHEEDLHSIVFNRMGFDNAWYDEEYEYICGAPTAEEETVLNCSAALRKFIRKYASIKIMSSQYGEDIEQWMLEDLIKKRLDDIGNECGNMPIEELLTNFNA